MPSRRRYKRWSHAELHALLNYMAKSVEVNGKFGFKPIGYYENLIRELSFDVPVNILYKKIERIKSKYKDFVTWEKTIGVGIKDEAAREIASKKKFIWYEECRKLWGKDITIHPPYFSPPTVIGRTKK
ncbi:unnamed protein product [Allacma fusca]|uniref:Uncharacterized protein n=1 Tax=Allacma fusca TaxID=39272 RepID=A0A8J2K1H4_9HEXA|nr:unnamed protein product [Allacma fusca]